MPTQRNPAANHSSACAGVTIGSAPSIATITPSGSVSGDAVHASHNMCRALVPADRQFSDDQIRALLERNAVIGMALDAWMLYPGWKVGQTTNEVVSLANVADHVDHVCQIAGNAKHVGIGSDLDGGFGNEQAPHDLGTIAGMQKLDGILKSRGYSDADIDGIFHGNWLRFFTESLPKGS